MINNALLQKTIYIYITFSKKSCENQRLHNIFNTVWTVRSVGVRGGAVG
jgi:hypothetical protein